MAELLTQRVIYDQIKYIVKRARRFCVIISPYVDFDELLSLIKLRKSNDVYIEIYTLGNKYSKNKLHDEDIAFQIDRITNVYLYYYPLNKKGLFDKIFHCKCYFNECRFLNTSLNLSWVKNDIPFYHLEFGVLFNKYKDRKLYNDSLEWFVKCFRKDISGSSIKIDFLFNHPKLGHCISCNRNICFNVNKPFCSDCYKIWVNKHSRDVYSFYHYCHRCGKKIDDCNYDICFANPVCLDCGSK